jgi:zinc/manganese transport system substrate-binding protein
LFSGRQVRLLAYNEQTSSPVTEKVLSAAKADHIPVVPVTETLPAHTDYLAWMGKNLDAVRSALG